MSTTSSPARSSRASTPASVSNIPDTRLPAAYEEEDDEPVVRPRGRMAARMAGASVFQEDESSSDDIDDIDDNDDNDPHAIYLKMRQQMMAGKSATGQSAARPSNNKTAALSSSPAMPHRSSHADSLSSTWPDRQPAHRRSLAQRSSPGLSKSPAKLSGSQSSSTSELREETPDDDSSDPDLPAPNSSRLQQLTARRREERLAREAAENEAREARAARAAQNEQLFNDEEPEADVMIEDKLTQQARPTRKASKKALEDMNKETQRMSRNMQLTHQAKVKKRYTMQDFLAGFNGKKVSASTDSTLVTASLASASSDVEAHPGKDTPPSSPPSPGTPLEKAAGQKTSQTAHHDTGNNEDDLPSMDYVLSQPAVRRAIVLPLPKPAAHQDDSDDDLEIVKDRFSVFDSIPNSRTCESRTLLTLRRLAHISSAPEKVRGKKNAPPSMTPAQLEIELRKRASLQARQERDEKIAALKAKGVFVMTEEEREKEQMDIENMLDRARKDANEIRKKERRAAKENGEESHAASDDESEDDDYVASGDEGETAELALSGSEDEEEVLDEGAGMVNDEAGEDSQDDAMADDEQDDEADDDDNEQDTRADGLINVTPEDVETPARKRTAPRMQRMRRVIEDDEDEDDAAIEAIVSPNNNELAAAFGFGLAPAAPMGFTQMFAGTMESQTQADTQEQDSLDIFHQMPSAPVPTYEPTIADETQEDAVGDSQAGVSRLTQDTPQEVLLAYTQASIQSPAATRHSQFSQIPDPSQDVGFDLSRSPARLAAPQSTIDTVILPVPESPIVQRRGRLVKRADLSETSDDEVDQVLNMTGEATKKPNVFDVMRQAATRPAETLFDKKRSEAKYMVDEQAEESEDEYAGLGGASDEEDAGEADEADKQMIDESDINVNEREIAAFHANKERTENEAQTSKLYKDLMSGALRRKQTGAFDLDSDEDDQLAERRRRKQREEARKRRLLLDDTVGRLDNISKKEAFLRAIEDRDEDDEDDLLDDAVEEQYAPVPDSQQAASQDASQEPFAEVSGNALKRKRDAIDSQGPDAPIKRVPAPGRRLYNAAFTKPTSLAEVRESVSFLIDEPLDGLTIHLSDSEHEEEDETTSRHDERAPFNDRRPRTNPAIVDRLTLMRTSTSSLSETHNGTMAFRVSSSSVLTAYKTPSLLRRATSQAMPPPAALVRDNSTTSDGGVRMGGSKKSSIHYQAREAERRVVVERAERAKAENVKKIAGLRRKGGLGSLMGLGTGFE